MVQRDPRQVQRNDEMFSRVFAPVAYCAKWAVTWLVLLFVLKGVSVALGDAISPRGIWIGALVIACPLPWAWGKLRRASGKAA